MVAKYLAVRPSSPLPPSPSSSPTVMSSSAPTLTQISIPPPTQQAGISSGGPPPPPPNHNGHHIPFVPSRSPGHIGTNGNNGAVFHGLTEGPTPLNCGPPGVGIGGKFIFKSNVIQGPGEMPPGAPFLIMKPHPPPINHQFAPDHNRVVLVAGRHMQPSASPPNSQPILQTGSNGSSVPGHSPQSSSHGHSMAPNAGGVTNGPPSNSGGSAQNGGANNGGRRTSNGKAAPLTSREKKDLFTQRKQREFIPDNKKDDNYWDRRRRNNEAAKRSREKRRFNDMILEQRVIELTKENHILKAQLDAIKDKYNICGENLISLDQILNTMPTPDQVLNVNNAGHLTIASGLTTQHFRNFQLAREARADSVIMAGSPAKKMKVSPKSEDRSNSGGDDEDSNNNHSMGGSSTTSSHNEMAQPDCPRRDQSPKEKEFYKRSVSPIGVGRLVMAASPLPPSMDKSPPIGLLNYSLRDMYYNSANSNGTPNPLHHHSQPPTPQSSTGPSESHRPESDYHPTSFPYGNCNGNVPVKYEEPDDAHHCSSPPYRPHPAHVPHKMPPSQTGIPNSYFYEEARRKRFEESAPADMHDDDQEVEHREQFMLLHRRQPEGTHLSQLELILNLSAKRDAEIDQRSVGEHEGHCTDRDSPVIVAATTTKNHANLLPLKLRHKANAKHEMGGPELRRVQLLHGCDEGPDDDVEPPPHNHYSNASNHIHHLHSHHLQEQGHHRYDHPNNGPQMVHHHHHPHHNHQLHLRHSPIVEHNKAYSEDGRLVKTEDYDDDEDELQHQQRIIEGGNTRRVHCCIEVEKLSSPRPDEEHEDKRYKTSVEISSSARGISPKPNNNILKSQLARLETEMATIKNMMYMNTNQATAAAQ